MGDLVVFTSPPKFEQKLWPAHCVQESWGLEFHKDLIVSNKKNCSLAQLTAELMTAKCQRWNRKEQLMQGKLQNLL